MEDDIRAGERRDGKFFISSSLIHDFTNTMARSSLSLQEKPTSAKLYMLYRKSLFVLALNMACSQWLDESSMADIHRRYGDHLYTKGDYDGGNGAVC